MCDELADTDVDGGKAMSQEKFMDPTRWHGGKKMVLKHLFKKHEGELVEVVGKWVEGTGDIPDPLFDPQFTQNEDDFKLCKSLDQVRVFVLTPGDRQRPIQPLAEIKVVLVLGELRVEKRVWYDASPVDPLSPDLDQFALMFLEQVLEPNFCHPANDP